MEWDQYLFSKFVRVWKRFLASAPDPDRAARAVALAELKPRLTILARALTSAPIEIADAEAEGGYQGNVFFLPPRYDCGPTEDDNRFFYLFRVTYLAMQREMGLNGVGAAPRVLERLFTEYPMIQAAIEAFITIDAVKSASAYLWGKWMAPGKPLAGHASMPKIVATREQVLPQTELKAPPREEIESTALNQKAAEDYTLNHYFEKVETIEEWNGTWRSLDGSDDLGEHAEALEEVNLRQTVRTDQPVHSVYRIDFRGGAGIPESVDGLAAGASFVSYPEWDYKHRVHRPDFCKVFPSLALASQPAYCRHVLAQHAATLNRLRKHFDRLRHSRERVLRQSDGDDLDLDAVVAACTDIRAQHTPSDFLYVARRKRRRDLSLVILVDTSLSTDAYEADERVIDVEKKAIVLLSDVLALQDDRFEISGFSSRTRNHCDYITVKRFSEPWQQASSRLGALAPNGYTRIGPAVRHATALLERELSRKRWILLLSDGKPGDYDRYEGRYGIEDVRQSVRDAERTGVRVFALAIQAAAKHYLPYMFGKGRFRILPRPQLLPEALTAFYSDLQNH